MAKIQDALSRLEGAIAHLERAAAADGGSERRFAAAKADYAALSAPPIPSPSVSMP